MTNHVCLCKDDDLNKNCLRIANKRDRGKNKRELVKRVHHFLANTNEKCGARDFLYNGLKAKLVIFLYPLATTKPLHEDSPSISILSLVFIQIIKF